MNEYRYERKFLITEMQRYEIEHVIMNHPTLFSEIYSERRVNNIYFDTKDMRNYFDNVFGLNDRMKTRIRWYGEAFKSVKTPTLEIKIKNGLVGRKVSCTVRPFTVCSELRCADLVKVVKESDILPQLTPYLLNMRPVLLNTYRRKYYLSADKNYRLTLDTGLLFYRFNPCWNSYLEKRIVRETTILELKYGIGQAESAAGITNQFPFRMTKSSKYVDGVKKLQLM